MNDSKDAEIAALRRDIENLQHALSIGIKSECEARIRVERLRAVLFRARNYIAGEITFDRPRDAMLEQIDSALRAPCDDAEFGMKP